MSEEIGSLRASWTVSNAGLTSGLKSAARQLSSFKKQYSPLTIDLGFNQKRFRGELSSVSRALSGLRRDFAKPITATIGQRGAAETVKDVAGVGKALGSIDGKNATVQIGEKGAASTVASMGAVSKARSSLDGKDAAVEVKERGGAATVAGLGAVKKAADSLNGQNAAIEVGERGAAPTVGQLAGVNAAADRVDGRNIKLGFDASQLDILGRLNTGLSETATRIRSVQTVGATAAIPVFIAGIAGIVPVATAAGAALGGLASAAGQGLAGGLGAGLSALSGFAGGLGLLYAAAFPTIKAFSDMETNSNALSTAQNGLKTATDGLATAQQSAQSAARSLADAQKQAAEGVADAERAYQDSLRGVADAQRAVKDAERGLHDAQAGAAEEVADAEQAYEDALRGVADAQRAVKQAQRGIHDAQAEAARSVADAERAYQDALRGVADAERGVADSRRTLMGATQDLRSAQLDLNQAQRDEPTNQAYATLDLADVRDRASDATREYNEAVREYGANSEEATDADRARQRAQLDLQETEREVQETRRKGSDQLQSSKEGVESASKAERDARQGVADSERALQDAREESGRAYAGITAAQQEGAKGVADAQRGVADAQREVAEAQRKAAASEAEINEARKDGAQQVADAQRQISDAQRGVADSMRASEEAQAGIREAQIDGAKQIADAQRGVKDAQAEVAAALAKVATAQAEVTANTKGLTASQSGLLGVWQKVSAAAGRIFKPANDDLNDLAASTLRYGSGALPALGSAAQKTVGGLSGAIETLKGTLGSSQQLALFNRFLANIPGLLEKGVVAAGSFGGGIANMLIAALPAAGRMTDALAKMGEGFRSWSASAEGQSALTAFFNSASQKGAVLLGVFRDLTLGIVGLGGAFDESGLSGRMLQGLSDMAARFRAFTAAGSEGRAMLVDFSTAAQPTLDALWRLLGGIGTEWGRVAGALIRARDEAGKLIVPQALDGIRKALPVIGNLLISTFSRFGPMLGPLVSGVAGLLTAFIAFNPVLQRLTGFIVGVLDAFNSLPRPMQTVLVSLASIASIMGAAGVGFSAISAVLLGGTIPAIVGLGAALAPAGVAVTGLGAALGAIASAALPVVAVVGGLAAAGYLVYKNWNTLGPIFQAVGGVVGGLLKNAFTNFMDAARPVWNFIKALGGGLLQGAADGLGRIGGHISDIFGTERFQQGAKDIKAALTPPDGSAWDSLKAKVAGFFGWLEAQSRQEGTGINKIWTKLTDDEGAIDRAKVRWTQFTTWLKGTTAFPGLRNIWQKLTDDKGAIDNAKARWQQFKTWLSGALKIPGVQNIWTKLTDDQGAIDRLKLRWNQLKLFAKAAWMGIGIAVQNAWKNIQARVQAGAEAVQTRVQGAWARVRTTTTAAWNTVKNAIQSAWQAIVSRAQSAIQAVQARVQAGWARIRSITTDAWNAVKNSIESAWQAITSRVQSALQSVQSRVQSAWNRVRATTTSAFNAVRNFLQSVWQQITNRIQAALQTIQSRIQSAWNAVRTRTTQAFDAVRDAISSRMERAKELAVSAAETLKDKAMSVFNSLPSPIQSIFQKIRDYISDPIGTAVDNVKGFLGDLIGVVNKVLDVVGIKTIGVDFGSGSGGSGGGSNPPTRSPISGGPVAMAKGGVIEGARTPLRRFAEGGASAGGMGTDSRQPRMHMWNEQQGPEAYIVKNRPKNEQTPYLREAADWHGYDLLPRRLAKPSHRGGSDLTEFGRPEKPRNRGTHRHALGGLEGLPIQAFAYGGFGKEYFNSAASALDQEVMSRFPVDGSSYAGHPAGAVDFLVSSGQAQGQEKATGDAVAGWLDSNYGALNLRALIWYARARYEGGPWQPYVDNYGGGSSDYASQMHYNHPHAESLSASFGKLNEDQTKGFTGGGGGGSPGGGISIPNPKQIAFEQGWKRLVQPLVDRILKPMEGSENLMVKAAGAMARKVPKGIYSWIDEKIPDTIGGTGGTGGSGPYKGGGNLDEWAKNGLILGNAFPPTSSNIEKIKSRAMQESGGDPMAQNDWDCLYTSAMILTRRGWLAHDEVEVGDETIGYDFETGQSKWTKITRVVFFENAEVVRIGHKRWGTTATRNHRWVADKRVARSEYDPVCPKCGREFEVSKGNALAVHMAKAHGMKPEVESFAGREEQFIETGGLTSNDRLRLSAPADTGNENAPDITIDEAAIFGWIAGDGHVEKKNGGVTIGQTKPDKRDELRALLERAGVPYSEYKSKPNRVGNVCHTFRLPAAYKRSLFSRAPNAIEEPEAFVASLSPQQRRAWLDAMIDAEGTRWTHVEGNKADVRIYQNDGSMQDAIKLAVYLEGYRPSTRRLPGKEQWSPCSSISPCEPHVTMHALTIEDAGTEDVWCVTTELGSWTAGDNGHVFLTGNSNAAAGTPSKGLMQVIEPTWNSNTTSEIGQFADNWSDPVKSVGVSSRYMKGQYGYVVGATGQGYDKGGPIPGRDGETAIIKAHAGEIVLPRAISTTFVDFTKSLPSLTGSLRQATRFTEKQVERMPTHRLESSRGGFDRTRAAPAGNGGLSDPETKALLREVRDGIRTLNERGVEIGAGSREDIKAGAYNTARDYSRSTEGARTAAKHQVAATNSERRRGGR